MEPRLYRISLRALSWGELWRHATPVQFVLAALLRGAMAPQGAHRLPALHAELRAAEKEVPADLRAAIEPARSAARSAGYLRETWQVLKRAYEPGIQRGAGWIGLADDGGSLALVNAVVNVQPGSVEKLLVTASLVAMREDGSNLVATNLRAYLDGPPGSRVVLLKRATVPVLLERITAEVRASRAPVRVFRDLAAAVAAMDAESVELLRARVERGLFVPMSHEESEAAERVVRDLGGGAAPIRP